VDALRKQIKAVKADKEKAGAEAKATAPSSKPPPGPSGRSGEDPTLERAKQLAAAAQAGSPGRSLSPLEKLRQKASAVAQAKAEVKAETSAKGKPKSKSRGSSPAPGSPASLVKTHSFLEAAHERVRDKSPSAAKKAASLLAASHEQAPL